MWPLFIVSGPSGVGKSSLVAALLEAEPQVRLSVSWTTRQPRPQEQHARHYHFVSSEQFEQEKARGGFLECAQVHSHWYGTSRSWVEHTRQSSPVVLEIDWQGAFAVKQQQADAVSIFILPPDLSSLAQRLHHRAQDDAATIQKRLAAAEAEISHADAFDYRVVNQDFDHALSRLRALVDKHCQPNQG